MYFLSLHKRETMGKTIKKIQIILSIVILTSISVSVLVFVLTLLPPVQRWSSEKLTSSISETLGVKVTADRLKFFPFTTVGLFDIDIYDANGEAMADAKSIKVDFSMSSLWNMKINLSEITFDRVSLMIKERADGKYNIQDLLQNSDTSATMFSVPNVIIKAVTLRDCNVDFVPNKGKKQRIVFINSHIDDISIDDSQMSAKVSYVTAYDNVAKRPFSFSCVVSQCDDTIKSQGIEGYYGNSVLDVNDVRVVLGGEEKVSELYADVNKLFVDDKVLTMFLPMKNALSVNLKGNILYTPSLVDVKNLEVTTSGKSLLETDMYIENYNERGSIKLNGDVKRCLLNIAEIESVLGRSIMDSNISAGLGNVEFSGTAIGSSEKIECKGVLVSNIGSMNIDGSVFLLEERVNTSGKLYSKGMDLSLISNGALGPMSFTSDISGYIENDSLLFAQIDGNIEHLVVRDYRYKNIVFNGFTNVRQGNLLVELNDENGSLHVIGDYERQGVKSFYSVTAKVDSLRTGRTNLTPSYPEGVLSFASRLTVSEQTQDAMRANLLVDGLTFTGATYDMDIKRIILDLNQDGQKKDIVLESDYINGLVNGEFSYTDVWPSLFNQALGSVGILGSAKTIARDVNLNMDVRYSDITPIMQFVLDSLSIGGQGRVTCQIDSKSNMIALMAKSNQIKYKGYEVEDVQVDALSQSKSTMIDVKSSLINIPMLGVVVDAGINNKIENNCIESTLSWYKNIEGRPKTSINLNTCLAKDYYGYLANINVKPSQMVFESDAWNIQESLVSISTHSLSVNEFKISSEHKYLSVDGEIDTKAYDDTLYLTINDFVVEDIIKTDPSKDRYTLAGDLSAKAKITDFEDSYIVDCTADIQRFFVNGDNLERLDIATNWSSERNRLDLDLAIVTQDKCRAHGVGGYDIKNNDFNIYFDIDSLSVGFLNHYLNSPIKHISGTTSGKLTLAGVMPDVKLNARLMLNESPFSVRQTMVDYTFVGGDSIILSPEDMEFRDLRFVDKYGNQGTFYGHIRHDMFTGLKLDLAFGTKDLLVLETTETQSPTYYGNIYADGLLNITGTTSNVELLVTAVARPNTIFNILPLGKGDMHENTYIKFTSPDKGSLADQVDYQAINSSVTAQINVKIDPSSQICVIVNPRTNNMIRATGNGDLRLTINRSGDLNIFGDYIIENGKYNFSFENILNKQFNINQGSSLSWDGLPYNAMVDLVATYNAKASLYDLVAGMGDVSTNSELKRRVPVNVNIHLTERLADPNIKFDIDIPSSLNFNQYTFDQYVNSEDEMNRQAISLLLSNRFSIVQESATSGQNNTSGYVSTTVSELLSNQISNWISQNKYNVNFGVNYRPGDEVTNEEYGVALSTQILNNKIILSGNIGYGRDISESSEGAVIGDFDIEYKINKAGNLRAKAYTHSNNDVIYETSPTTQGIGISFSEEFNTFRDLMRKYWGVITGKRKRENSKENK